MDAPKAKKPAAKKPAVKSSTKSADSKQAAKKTVKKSGESTKSKDAEEAPLEPAVAPEATSAVRETKEQPTAEIDPPTEPVAKVQDAQKPRAKKTSPVDIAAAKYSENGWTIIKPPRGSVNDFIANRNGRLHFVQVVTKETYEDPKYHGGAKNDFVQNAMSNSAIPVFAHVVGGSKPKVTFQDVNTNNRVIVSQRSKTTDEKK